MDWEREERELTDQANALVERGLALQDMNDLPALEAWDDAVNALLTRINTDLATDRLASRRLKRRLDHLILLYGRALATMASLEADQVRQTQALTGARRAIRG